MSTLAYRLRLYAPGSTSTVLTPPVNAADGTARAHSDAFQVATIAGVSGYQPYLFPPTVQRGALDIGSKQTSVGECTVKIGDIRTGTGNAARWASAFLGDGEGRTNVLGCYVEIDRSVDGGSTWPRWFTGRVASRSLDGLLAFGLPIREESDRMQRRVFVGTPHASATAASVSPLWPLGRLKAWGSDFPALTPIQGSVSGGPLFLFQVDAAWQRTFSNRLTKPLADAGAVVQGTGYGYSAFTQETVPRIVFANGATGKVSGIVVDQARNSITQVQCIADTGTIPSGATSAVIVDAPLASPTELTPLLIGPVHPVVLWRDLLQGYYGRLTLAGALPTDAAVRFNASAFTAAESWALPSVRVRVDEPAEMGQWIEEHILRPFHLGYRINASGEIVPVDLRRRSTYPGILTITDADLVRPASNWTEDSAPAYERLDVTVIRDTEALPPAADETAIYEDATCRIVSTNQDRVLILGDDRQIQVGRQVLEVAPATWRVSNEEPLDAIAGDAVRLESELRGWIGYGARTLVLDGSAASANTAVEVGDYCIVNTTTLPNLGSNQRGGARLALCVGRTESGVTRSLTLLDAGPNSAAGTPTIASLTLATNTITATVTRNAAADDVEVSYAHTTTAVSSAPAEASPLWTVFGVLSATGSASVAPRPIFGRVWVRARSLADRAALDPKQPSAYVAPSPASIDITGAPTFGSLSATEDGATETYDLAWTNTDTVYPVLVTLTPSGGATQVLATLPAGSTTYRVYHTSDPRGLAGPLRNGTSYTVAVTLAHPDYGAGRLSASASFTTGTATPPSAPTVTASITDAAPSFNLNNAQITYTSSGGALTVTKNGGTVTPSASPWVVTRPSAGVVDTYVFTVTATNGVSASATVVVQSNDLFAGSSGVGVSVTRRYSCQDISAVDVDLPNLTTSVAAVRTTLATGTVSGRAYIQLPDGVTITGFAYRGQRATSSQRSYAGLLRINNDATFTDVSTAGGIEVTAGAGFNTVSQTGITEVTNNSRLYCAEFYLDRAGGVIGSAEALWWDITYTVPNLGTGLG